MPATYSLVTSITEPLWRALSLLLWPLAIIWRCQNWAGVFYGNEVFLYSTDPYYHLRRVFLTLQNFPHVPDTDPFLNFPYSAATHWPFAFDLFAAGLIQLLSKICGQDPQNIWWVTACSALMPPLLGGLLAVFSYQLARKFTTPPFAYLAGLIVAWLPAAIHYAQLGNFDHHWWAALCQAIFLLGYLGSYSLPDQLPVSRPQASTSQYQYPYGTTIAALAATLALIGATEFPLILATHCLFLGLVWWRLPDQRLQLVRINLLIFGQIAVLLLPFVFTQYFEPHGVSPLLGCAWLGVTTIALLLLSVAIYQGAYSSKQGIAVIVLITLLLLIFDFSLISQFLAEFYRSQGNTVLARFIAENRPVLQAPLLDILWWQSALLLLVPFSLYRLWQQATPNTLLLFVYLLIIEPLSLAHERFSVLATLPLVLATVYYLANIWPQTAAIRQPWRQIAFIGGILLLLLPSLQRVNFAETRVVQPGFLPLHEPLQWLARNTPAVSPQQPHYGVLTTDWGIGHWLVYYGTRPTVASPLLHTAPLANAVTTTAQLLTATPQQAIPQMHARQLHYIFFTYQEFSYLLELLQHPAAKQPTPQLLTASLYGQILLNYGLRSQTLPQHTIDRLRLLYEAPTNRAVEGNSLPTCLILELVPGAQLHGQTIPGSTINLRTTLITNNGRNILYQQDLIANQQGYFTATLPYATGRNGAITVAPYSVAYNGQEQQITVTSVQVSQGLSLQLPNLASAVSP